MPLPTTFTKSLAGIWRAGQRGEFRQFSEHFGHTKETARALGKGFRLLNKNNTLTVEATQMYTALPGLAP